MKSTIFCFIALVSVASAQAGTEVLSLDCQAKELKVGGQEGRAQILVVKNEAPVGERSMSLSFVFGTEILNSDAISCGVKMPAQIKCDQTLGRPGLPFQLGYKCGDGAIDGTGTYRFPIETSLVVDMNETHGRFYCRNKEASVFRTIEFMNCQ